MRRIIFRGKRTDNGKWVASGNLIRFNPENGNELVFIPGVDEKCTCTHDEHGNIIAFDEGTFYKVDPNTVGQYTGLVDKNGTKIFEGDVVKVTEDEGNTDFCDGGIGDVSFYDGLWYVSGEVNNGLNDLMKCYYVEVIGNIH